jgi:uncharacterized protein (TIGR02266 family)
MSRLQAKEPTPPEARAVAEKVAIVVRHLYAAETRDVDAVLSTLGDARRVLLSVVEELHENAPSDGSLHAAQVSLAASLRILHPARAELELALERERMDEKEPVIPLARPRVSRTPERRKDVDRIPVEAVVGFSTDTNFFTGWSGDVSDGGLFVATWNVQPIGTAIELSFVLPSGKQVNVEGSVAWVREPPQSLEGDFQPGMGVRFERISDQDRAAVLEFVRSRAPIFHD